MRVVIRTLAIAVLAAALLVVLAYGELLVWPKQYQAAMADTIPACDGRVVAEGFSYKLTDPDPGDVVAVHADEGPDGDITPDEDADDLTLILRVAGEPGDVVVGRDGFVFVDDVKFDDVATEPFPPVTLFGDQYFLLGDNRSAARDSRDFGPVLEDAIFARALIAFWPLRDIGLLGDRESGTPPGEIDCP